MKRSSASAGYCRRCRSRCRSQASRPEWARAQPYNDAPALPAAWGGRALQARGSPGVECTWLAVAPCQQPTRGGPASRRWRPGRRGSMRSGRDRLTCDRPGHKAARRAALPEAVGVSACIGASRNEARAVDSRSASAVGGATNWPRTGGPRTHGPGTPQACRTSARRLPDGADPGRILCHGPVPEHDDGHRGYIAAGTSRNCDPPGMSWSMRRAWCAD